VEAAEESLETAFQSFEVVSIASIDSLSGQPCLSDTTMMVARVMLGYGYEPRMGLGKNNGGRTSLVSTRGNRGKFVRRLIFGVWETPLAGCHGMGNFFLPQMHI